MTEKLKYVRKIGEDTNRIYRVVDDKTVDGVHKLILLIVEGDGTGYHSEALPDELVPALRSWEEDAEFYRRIDKGPKTIVRAR